MDSSPLVDAGGGMFMATVRLDKLFENCMPIVAPDPLQVMGTLEITNTGAVPIGPVTATQGILTTESLMELGRFGLGPTQLASVAPGATGSVPIVKTSGTLMPANGCGMSCGMLVRVRIPIAGPNVPDGSVVSSPLTALQCAM
jgi:hypothetical protein